MLTEQLLVELTNRAAQGGNRTLERRLADTAVWMYKNIRQVPPEHLGKRVELLHKALDIMLELNALLLQRVHNIEELQLADRHGVIRELMTAKKGEAA